MANLAVHDKKTAKGLQQKSLEEFWADLGFPKVRPNDPLAPKNFMRKPVVSVNGTAVFVPKQAPRTAISRWNYNSTCIDPTNPRIIWIYMEYVASTTPGQLSTCGTAFRVKLGP